MSNDRSMTAVTRDIVIQNTLGLHARPAMQFVEVANSFNATITVHKAGDEPVTVDGKSVMQMITLEAIQGTPLKIEADGDDAEQAIEQLTKLVNDKFGEED
ncbi:MAG: HPr family phosphocarrier protein [Tepidisphaeraceae bacterium]